MKEQIVSNNQVGNYLSKIRPKYERRRFERRKCNFMGRVLFTERGTRCITQYIVIALDISEVGIRIHTTYTKEIPRHFYFFVGKYQHGIGCIVVGRDKDILRCEFIKEESTKLVDFLAQVKNPNSTLGELKTALLKPSNLL